MKLLKTLLTGLYGVWSILGIVLIFTGAVPLFYLPVIGLFVCTFCALNGNGGKVAAGVAYLTAVGLSLAFPLVVYLMTSSDYNPQTQSREAVVLVIFGVMGMLTMFSLLFSTKNPLSGRHRAR